MPKTNLTTLEDLKVKMQGLTDLKALKRVLTAIDNAQGDKAIMSTKRTFIIKTILEQRTDLKNSITCIYNRGSQLEVLTARQVLGIENHIADSTPKQDAKIKGNLYEIKSFTNNNACKGYSTRAEWLALGTTTLMVLTFEDRAYKIPKATWQELFNKLSTKTETKNGKTTVKIRGTRGNWKIVHAHCNGKHTALDLTV